MIIDDGHTIVDEAIESFLYRYDKEIRSNQNFIESFSLLSWIDSDSNSNMASTLQLFTLIRQVLVDSVLQDLFICYGYRVIAANCKSANVQFDAISNYYEPLTSIEFIIQKDNMREGFRFTPLRQYSSCCDETESVDTLIDKLCIRHSLDKIIIINLDVIYPDIKEYQDSHYPNNPNIEILYLHQIFDRYFPHADFSYYFSAVNKVLHKIRNSSKYKVAKTFCADEISDFKLSFLRQMSKTGISELLKPTIEQGEEYIVMLSASDCETIDNSFINNSYQYAFIANNNYSNCFITSEYFFSMLRENSTIDWTSVVCGYFKSVEQLLFSVMNQVLLEEHNNDIWIKSKWIPTKTYHSLKECKVVKNSNILFKQEYYKFFDTSMGSLINWFSENKHMWCISNDGRLTVTNFLRNYKERRRNGFFHKHNIDDYMIVKQVRNETLIAFFMILGSISLADSKKFTIEGEYSYLFERFYRSIEYYSTMNELFVIEINGIKQKVILNKEMGKANYNAHGLLTISEIVFDIVAGESCIVVNRMNIPTRAWTIFKGMKEEILIWSVDTPF